MVNMKLKLIENWQQFYKMWSIRFTAIGTSLLTFLLSSPDTILYSWNMLPTDLKGVLPVNYTLYISMGLLVLGMISRIVKQPKLQQGDTDGTH